VCSPDPGVCPMLTSMKQAGSYKLCSSAFINLCSRPTQHTGISPSKWTSYSTSRCPIVLLQQAQAALMEPGAAAQTR